MNNHKIGRKAALLLLVLVWICSISAFAEGASGDNSLYSLGIITEGVTVSPEFYYSTIEYNVTVPAGTTKLELEPVTSNENAWIVDISGADLVDGQGTVTITVSAENGSEYSYYLYVTTADGAGAGAGAAVETETEAQTEKATEKETEPETEDPRYVKVDRNSLQEAENTISTLKSETSSFRDRLSLLMKILYGLIGFCVILLFIVINLILKKKDLKAELQEYMGYGYPEETMPNAAPVYEDPYAYATQEEKVVQPKKPKKMKDDPASVPKPSKAKKKSKPMPEYQPPQPEYQYQPPQDETPEHVEVNMIDL